MKRGFSTARRLFLMFLLQAGFGGGTLAPAFAQSWQSSDWVPLFRPTAVQQLALGKALNSAVCLGHLSQLWNAANTYSFDHAGRLPGDWRDFTNGLATPSAFYCPADTAHPAQTNWSQVDFSAISYELVAPGILASSPEQTFIRCRVHQNVVTSRGRTIEARPYEKTIPWGGIPTPSLGIAKEAAVSVNCLNNLHQIGAGAQLFATDHADVLPQSFHDFAETGMSPAVLRCPADVLHPAPVDFSDASIASANYTLDSPGASAASVGLRLATCRIHSNYVTVAGLVIQGTNRYPPRLILGHPLSRTVAPGHTTTLEVLIGDPTLGPFRFQWRTQQPLDAAGEPFTNTVEIAGATNATMVITNAGPEHEGYYDVVVWDAQGGYQRSDMAYVRVEPLANVTIGPEIICLNNLYGIGLAARMYAPFHQDAFPGSLAPLPQFLGWPLTLYCPADGHRQAPSAWALVDFDNTSYTFNAGVPLDGTTNVLATCKVHGYSVQAGSDGTVISDPPRFFALAPPDNSGLVLGLIGRPNTTCVLESSPDLATWSAVVTNVMTYGSFQWTNSAWNTDTARFYRARIQ